MCIHGSIWWDSLSYKLPWLRFWKSKPLDSSTNVTLKVWTLVLKSKSVKLRTCTSLYRSTDWGMAHADQRCCRCRHLHRHRHLLGGVPPSSPSLTNWSVNKLLSSPTNTWYIYYSVLSHSYSDSPVGFDWVSISFFSLSKLQGKAIYAMRLIALQNKFLRAR